MLNFKHFFPDFLTWENILKSYGVDIKYILPSDYKYLLDLSSERSIFTKDIKQFYSLSALKWEQFYSIYLKQELLYQKNISELNEQININTNSLYDLASNSNVTDQLDLTKANNLEVQKYLSGFTKSQGDLANSYIANIEKFVGYLNSLKLNNPKINLYKDFLNAVSLPFIKEVKGEVENVFWNIENGALNNATSLKINNKDQLISNVASPLNDKDVVNLQFLNSQIAKVKVVFDSLSIKKDVLGYATYKLFNETTKKYLSTEFIEDNLKANKKVIDDVFKLAKDLEGKQKVDEKDISINGSKVDNLIPIVDTNAKNINENKNAIDKIKPDNPDLKTITHNKDGKTQAVGVNLNNGNKPVFAIDTNKGLDTSNGELAMKVDGVSTKFNSQGQVVATNKKAKEIYKSNRISPGDLSWNKSGSNYYCNFTISTNNPMDKLYERVTLQANSPFRYGAFFNLYLVSMTYDSVGDYNWKYAYQNYIYPAKVDRFLHMDVFIEKNEGKISGKISFFQASDTTLSTKIDFSDDDINRLAFRKFNLYFIFNWKE